MDVPQCLGFELKLITGLFAIGSESVWVWLDGI